LKIIIQSAHPWKAKRLIFMN